MADVKVPVLGESITEATLGEWLKNPGDPVKLDERRFGDRFAEDRDFNVCHFLYLVRT